MDPLGASTDLLISVNVLLGVVCFGLLAAIASAAVCDLLEHRRRRPRIPDCWPPTGVDVE